VIAARNRHTVTPEGWAHEEHNRKLVLAEDGSPREVLVHEEGFNTYRPDEELALGIAEAYWEGTEAFWSDVRTVWAEVLSSDRAFRIEGGRTTNAFSTLADEYLEGAWRDDGGRLARVREVIDQAVTTLAPGHAPGAVDPERG
jgi:hypothetical protein